MVSVEGSVVALYDTVKEIQELYGCLQDQISRDTFWARLAFDVEPSIANAMKLLQTNPNFSQEQIGQLITWRDTIERLQRNGKKYVLYGTGGRGLELASALLRSGVEFYGFCGRKGPDAFPNGLMGKPVIAPEMLFQRADDFYVSVCAGGKSASEIACLLKENDFPEDHILKFFDLSTSDSMYFEFPKQYCPGTAFVDAGCYNCNDDYRFVEWSKGEYSSIIAFEPDPVQYTMCEKQLLHRGIRDMRLIQAGLSDRSGTAKFAIKGAGGSRIAQEKADTWLGRGNVQSYVTVPIVTLDDTITNETVGFIKMDIEGAELDALHGAAGTITRDKPFLAISVYHKPGDILAIMQYIHKLVPDYRFCIRHYGPLFYETVLYAMTDNRLDCEQLG